MVTRIGEVGTTLAVTTNRRSVRRHKFEPRLRHVGFMVDKAALAQVFSEYFSFRCQ
jgi:hypothetical protein